VVFAELDRHGAKLSINCGAGGIHLPDRRCRDGFCTGRSPAWSPCMASEWSPPERRAGRPFGNVQ